MSPLKSFLDWIAAKRTALASQLLKQYVQGRTLDVGCWDGLVARAVTDNVVGIDVYLHPSPVIPVTQYDGKHFPFQDKEFDTVLCCGALHHAEDQDAVISEMKRVGKRIVLVEDRYDNFIDRASTQALHAIGGRLLGMSYKVNGFRNVSSWKDFFKRHELQLVNCDAHPTIQPLWPGHRIWVFVLAPQ